MNNLKCLCGNIISTGAIPSENVFYLSSDESHSRFYSNYEDSHDFPKSYEQFRDESISIMKCSNCKRMYFLNNEEDGYSFTIYKPEENIPEKW